MDTNTRDFGYILSMSKKIKWRTELPEGFASPILSSVGPIFCEEGIVISGRLANRFGSQFGRTQNYCVELLALYLCRVNDYINAIFDDGV